MAFRDQAHREEVFRSPQYRRMLREWIANKSPVPLEIFRQNYGRAFFDRNGKTQKWNKTATSTRAFRNLMVWTGRVDRDMDPTNPDDWEDFEEESG